MVVLQLWALLAGATLMVAGESFTNGEAGLNYNAMLSLNFQT